MIGVTGETSATRVVAVVAVVALAALSLGSVVAAGWQNGTDAVGGLGSDPAGAMDRGDADGSIPGERVGSGPAKRDGDGNETDRSERTGRPNGIDGSGETSGRETTRTNESAVARNATEPDTSEATAAESGTDTPAPAAADDRNRGAGPGHAALGSGLWIVGILGVLTTLFSLGGFVAAVLAYQGTD